MRDVPFVLTCQADNFGCGFHRIQNPARWVAQNGIALSNVLMGYVPLDQLMVAKPTTLVLQRQVEASQVRAIKNLRDGLPGTTFIWEIDDLITNVPSDSVHEAFQPPARTVTENIREVLGYVDWATVPTEPLADWLREVRPGTLVKVIPNLLEELDSDSLPKIETKPGKPKIGWAGGISHVGDLKLIEPAIKALQGEAIKWQFMGLMPQGDFGRADIDFHPGTQPAEFLSTWMGMGVELVLAPLEVHPFNDAKSNLRIIQAGVQGAAVIASPAFPYRDKNPPVFAYCETPEEWEAAIRKWLGTSETERHRWRTRMRTWAQKHWGVRGNLALLADAWGLEMPQHHTASHVSNTVIINAKPEDVWINETSTKFVFEPDLELAQSRALGEGGTLLRIRSGTVLGHNALSRMLQCLRQAGAASVCGLSNDGVMGVDFLSNQQNPQLAGLNSDLNNVLDRVVRESRMKDRPIPLPLGPVVLCGADALGKIPMSEDMLDWGLLTHLSGGKNVFCPEVWGFAGQPSDMPGQPWFGLRGIDIRKSQAVFPPEERLVLEARCIREQENITAPGDPRDVRAWADIFGGSTHEPQSVARLRLGDQEGLERAKRAGTRWIFWEIPSTKYMDNAAGTLEIVGDEVLGDVVYCDAVGPQNSSCFRPAIFDIEWFKAWDYISGCCLIRAELWAWGAPIGRGEVFKRLLELARDGREFVHCQKILCTEEDTPDDESRAQSVQEVFPDFTAKLKIKGLIEVKRKLRNPPKVSVVMLTGGNTWVLRPGLATLLQRTDYPGEWEIILGRSGAVKGDPTELRELSDPRIKYVEMGEGPFNWSELNNRLARDHATGEYFVFLNDDTRVLDRSWLQEMIAYAELEDVGYVGLRLVTPQDGSVQHVGVYCDAGHTGHVHKGWQGGMPGYWGYARATHEASVVTGACIAIERAKFEKLGGFPEQYAYNFGDVSACLNARREGLRNICVCPTEMQHAESSTRPAFNSADGLGRLRREGDLLRAEYPEAEPYWNRSMKIAVHPNKLMGQGFNFELLNWGARGRGRVILLLNSVDPEDIGRISNTQDRVLVGVAEHGRLMLVKPGLSNAPAIELREKSLVGLLLKELGIDEIVEARATPESTYVRSCLE